MDHVGLESGPIVGVEPISGGTQNVLVRFQRGDRRFVLRRGPLHLRPTTNDALRKEMRLLDALAATNVPHPRLIAPCPDESVLEGAVFYLMEPVDGFNAAAALPQWHAHARLVRYRMGFAMVEALAALGAVDYTAVGLGGFGHPDGFLDRQVPRWLQELESYVRLEGYPGPNIGGVQQVAGWLERNRPMEFVPGIMHGDFHLANVMFNTTTAEVAAVVDWEMGTIGDPLVDLGWMVATWPDAGDRSDVFDSEIARAGGLPRADELVARYAETSERDLSAMPWYVVLACFKLGILLEGTYARACAGKAPMAVGERLHGMTLRLFDRARAMIAQS
ncbi:phosphotransferase family protein [Mycolicibacterium moriokaense]|nr:phosphotransferase family protein [Mycolicibacterium moriokaense]